MCKNTTQCHSHQTLDSHHLIQSPVCYKSLGPDHYNLLMSVSVSFQCNLILYLHEHVHYKGHYTQFIW